MAKITVIEQDNTVVNPTTGLENIVYVPGYASRGPINKPTLCNSYADFISKFGDVPFDFTKNGISASELKQNGNSTIEKSWVYAVELLKSGIPVLYERVYDTAILKDNAEDGTTVKAYINLPIYSATDELTEKMVVLTAKNEGTYGSEIKVSLADTAVSNTKTLDIELGSKKETFTVSTNPASDNYIEKELANSKLVDVSVVGTLEATDIIKLGTNITTALLTGGLDMTYAQVIAYLKATANNLFDKIADKLTYDVKFVTSGGYANIFSATDYSIAKKMMRVSAERGDALALLDVVKGVDSSNYLGLINTAFKSTDEINGAPVSSFGTVVGPQCLLECSSISANLWMPGSFVWLKCFAKSVVSGQNPVWFPIAGVVRGLVPNFIESEFEVGSVILNSWQDGKQCINPIMNVKAYGYCIFGNRTLITNADEKNPSALSFVNIRVLINELKKVVRSACLSLMYESNDSLLWNKFKALVRPTLDQMKTNRGLTDYKIERVATTKRATVCGIIRIRPIESAENFEITFSLENGDVTVEE